MGKVSRNGNTEKKNKNHILEIKNTAAEMRNAFDGLVRGLDPRKEGLSELEYIQ